MKLHSARGARLIFTLAFTVAVRIIPSAYAQMGLGLPARTALPAKPIAAQVGGNSLHRALPVLHMALLNPGPMGQATTTNLFAQVAIGGGSTTVFAFLNAGVDATTGNLILTQENGAPLTVSFSAQGVSGLVDSVFPVSIPPGGSRIITAGPVIPTDPTVSGWARVESTGGSLDGVATFQCLNGNALLYIAGVLSMNATPVATIPVDDDLTLGVNNRAVAYAVANPGNTPINIQIVLLNPDGTESQRINPPLLNPLSPGHHVATYLWQDLNNPRLQFQGSMVLIEQTATPFAVVALVQNQALFTVIPVSPQKAPGIVYR